MSETRQLVVDTTRRIFEDLGDPRTVNAAADNRWKRPLWQALEEAGLTQPMISEDLGGAGLSASDSLAILRMAGAFAVPVPLAETVIATACLSRGGVASPVGAMTIAPVRARDRIVLQDDGRLVGTAIRVPFATECDHLAVLAMTGEGQTHVALVRADACQIVGKANKAGEGRDRVTFDGAKPLQSAMLPGTRSLEETITFAAIVRSMQMAGALEALLEMSVRYSGERVAFGRPIAKFQAVQHNLARLAEETAAAVAISNSAAYALDTASDEGELFLEAASAKIRVGDAAGEGAAIAYQVHGAIGFTDEHVLYRYCHRLWEWRDDFGNESEWAARLGKAFCAAGSAALWPTLTAV